MNFRVPLGCAVALAMFATSTVEGLAFAGAPDAFPHAGMVGGFDHSADIAQVRAGNRRNVNVNVRRGPNVNVRRGPTVVVRRPVRVWAPRPYYGTIIAGVALGTVIAVSVAAAAPNPPASNLCWFWSDSTQMHGYWDYCTPPR
jgi:hypothetical protein